MLRTTSLMVLLAGLVACGQANEFELNALDANSPEAIAKAEEDAWQALHASGVLDGVEEVDLLATQIDDRGIGHVRYQQLHGGVPVFGGEVIAHVNRDGSARAFSDSLIHDIQVDVGGIEYSQVDAEEIALALDTRGLQPTEAPQTELVVLVHEGRSYLTWKVRTPFLDVEPGIPVRFIDAKSGELVFEYDDLKTASLSDSDHATYDMNNSTRTNRATVGDSSDSELLTTHTSVGQAISFVGSNWGYSASQITGTSKVNSYGHYSNNYVNAYWDGVRLVFGDGDGYYSNYLGVLDVAGHELAHAITDNIGPSLTYSYESGALNEGASDIFAAALEANVDGGLSQDTWDVGEDCWLDGRALRYMDAPSSDGSSRDYYANRYTGSQDNGGVHWNSGIANHWFYILVTGNNHHNASYASSNNIQGIGMDAAYRIFFEALDHYMTASTNFSGARTATESACSALGYSADTCHSVKLAWYEVGVGSNPGAYPGGGGTDTGGTDTGGTDTGGQDTGGQDTGGQDTGGTDTGGSGGYTCPSGFSAVTGTLTGSGDSDSYTYTANSGTHQFIMEGASGTDFDIVLYQANRSRWRQRASSTSASSSESISYGGSSGDYRIDVSSYSGSGDYTLCYIIP
ncbi:MAG: M4 family metallopeptidase [Alphaproteobacteria bacterium]|nr:M4 family metallopeptidase [Alphaproteobacteria bacterium]